MRIWFVIFLLCLLPLRGWTGTAMGMKMATQQVATSTKQFQRGLPTSAQMLATTMPEDCPMHNGVSGPNGFQVTDSSGMACSGCDTCELCLAIAPFTAAATQTSPFRHSSILPAVHDGFVSADTASRLKPPIS